jgi:purine-binding chemotaxis protein CheW
VEPASALALPTRKHVCFVACGQEFAAPVEGVLETTPLRPLSRVFHAEPFVAGVMSLRGEIVAVLDLGLLVGFGPTDLATGIVLAQSGRKRAGLLAERLSEVRELDPTKVGPVPQVISDEQAPFFRGVVSLAHGPVLLLDLDRVFADQRLRRYERRM